LPCAAVKSLANAAPVDTAVAAKRTEAKMFFVFMMISFEEEDVFSFVGPFAKLHSVST
jgi:hypothetical protein